MARLLVVAKRFGHVRRFEPDLPMTVERTSLGRRYAAAGRRAIALITAAALAVSTLPAHAQPSRDGGLPIIRDAETEQLLREYTTPILRAAGLAQQNIRIVIINDRS